MKLWTLCADRTRWKNNWTLYRSDSMGNVVDQIEKERNCALTYEEYPDDFLDSIAEVFDRYAYCIDEYEEYDNDDYDISSSSQHRFTTAMSPREMIVISEGRPVGHMVKSKEYGHGMDNRTWTYGTILFFDQPNPEAGETFRESYTVYNQNGRWSTRRTYSIVERN